MTINWSPEQAWLGLESSADLDAASSVKILKRPLQVKAPIGCFLRRPDRGV